MITVEHLAKAVGEDKTPVLQDIGFQLEPGEFVALLGASGSEEINTAALPGPA